MADRKRIHRRAIQSDKKPAHSGPTRKQRERWEHQKKDDSSLFLLAVKPARPADQPRCRTKRRNRQKKKTAHRVVCEEAVFLFVCGILLRTALPGSQVLRRSNCRVWQRGIFSVSFSTACRGECISASIIFLSVFLRAVGLSTVSLPSFTSYLLHLNLPRSTMSSINFCWQPQAPGDGKADRAVCR